jgi:Predicted membrane protein
MLRNYRNYFFQNKYSIAVFVLLNVACAICIGLVVARVAYSDTGRHLGLIWNLFLAWIPFMLAYFAHAVRWRRATLYIILPIIAFLWLIFYPNAPYMLTDLQDLARRASEAPLWYDVIIVVWCSWTGMLLGVISLYLMQNIVVRSFGRSAGWVFVFVISALSSFGIYIGRFVRLNSWDILQNPGETVQEILGIAIDPSRRLAAFTLLYTIFFLFVFLLLYSFSHMLQEQTTRNPDSAEEIAHPRPSHAQG